MDIIFTAESDGQFSLFVHPMGRSVFFFSPNKFCCFILLEFGKKNCSVNSTNFAIFLLEFFSPIFRYHKIGKTPVPSWACHAFWFQTVFFWSILCCSQNGDDPQDDLVKFGYKLNIKVIKNASFYIFSYLLELCIDIWKFFLIFFRIMAIENLKKHMILAFNFLNILFGYT